MMPGFAQSLGNPPLHHVGVVVKSEKKALAQMARLGLKEDFRGYVARWDVLCIFAVANGASPIEFVVPYSGPLLQFNQGLGGLHHIALAVPNLADSMAQMAANGVKMLEDEPVQGAGNFLCNFLPPIFTQGFAVELVQLLPPETHPGPWVPLARP